MSWSGSAGAIARGSTAFIEDLKNRLTTALGTLDTTLARGTAGVEIRERRGEPWITVPPIGKLAEPENLRHFLFTWLKTQGVDDALIQPYSGHETRTSLEIYSRLAITDAQREYDAVIGVACVTGRKRRTALLEAESHERRVTSTAGRPTANVIVDLGAGRPYQAKGEAPWCMVAIDE
jgi:hypothetical protein